MRRVHLIWIVPLSALLLLALAVAGWVTWDALRPPTGLESVGGSWQVVTIPSPFHGPGTTYRLYRNTSSRPVQVDESITRYRFYAPDCVVYQTIRDEYSGVVFAVCGERTPIAFMSDVSWNWEYAPEGLLMRKGHQLAASTSVVQVTRLKPIDRITALALEQPPYRKNWQRDALFQRNSAWPGELVENVELEDPPR